MNKTKLNCVIALACATAVFSTFTASAEISKKAIGKTLKAARAPELPAKAAALVSKANVDEREATTVAVVQTAIQVNRSAAAAVVGAIAHAKPKMAALAAATAVSLEPKQAAKIARAATSGALSEADNITAAMTKQAPSLSSVISDAVSSALSTKTVLADNFERPPQVGPPFVPRIGGTTELNPTNTVPVGPDGRDYSAP